MSLNNSHIIHIYLRLYSRCKSEINEIQAAMLVYSNIKDVALSCQCDCYKRDVEWHGPEDNTSLYIVTLKLPLVTHPRSLLTHA